MGGMCSKPTAVEDSRESPRERFHNKGPSSKRVSSSRRQEIIGSKDRLENNDVKAMLIDKKVNGSNRYYDNHRIEPMKIDDQIERKKMIQEQIERKKMIQDQIEKKRIENCQVNVINHPSMGRLPKAAEAEQVAAGWPSWLAAAAGDAIKGWIPRRANTFEKLDKIGQGTYSSVYRARDVIHDKIVALKKVRFDNNDPESVKFMAREIAVLRKLDHPNIIKLEGLITSQTACSLYLVFEYMEHDLVGLTSLPGLKFTEPQVKCYMKQLLSGLEHCHSHGVLHRDIKGSNLLIDNNGILKIADFGLASFFNPKDSSPMTSRVVTLWYRPPELLLGASHYGVAVDLWSAGCILGELFTGKPILPGKTEVEQLHRIFKLCGSPSEDYWRKSKLPHSTVFKPVQPYRRRIAETFKDIPATALGLMETLLSVDPALRASAAFALNSGFFTTQPFACDPSGLPKYPPSKEIDAKLRDEELRRQRAEGGRGHKVGQESSRSDESRAGPAHISHAEVALMKQRGLDSSTKDRNETFMSHKEVALAANKQARGLKEPSNDLFGHQWKKVSHSGPLVHGAAWEKVGKRPDHPPTISTRSNLSTLSGFVASRTGSTEDFQGKSGPSRPGAVRPVGRSQSSFRELSTGKQEYRQNNHKGAESPQGVAGNGIVKEASLHGRGPRGNKIYVSGPLLPSHNVDQLLKEHDQKIQEFARRAHLRRQNLQK
ncbi:probable serine/threonine-protein kinase At1g54610 isoform X2 [Mangifera indica]|uniref:probable serine/threonine-protein kinase At1g54610 isoform X2 n=1 Tax=Mangifera indica TaxID=29780 RepID=UPI001CFC21C9|nr:probable serine/threonine-protein kinase At1g54610 isoform X2 [Mangifera indica]